MHSDSSGGMESHSIALGERKDWYVEGGAKNLAILPAVTVMDALPLECSVGGGRLSGSWVSAEQSSIRVTVSGFIPPDATLAKRPSVEEKEPSLQWFAASSSGSYVPGLGTILFDGSPATLAPSYAISTGSTERRAISATFFAGILAGGALAGVYEFLRNLLAKGQLD